jgi:hypothetical protein
MTWRSNYDKVPFIAAGRADECTVGWDAVAAQLAGRRVLCVECYPGADVEEIERELSRRLRPDATFRASSAYRTPSAVRAMLAPHLGTDRVFGRMNGLQIRDWFDGNKLDRMRDEVVAAAGQGTVLVVGTGTTLLCPDRDALVYADMARWEIQQRQRRNILGNLGCDNRDARAAEKYKCGYFAEWPAADRLKKQLLPNADYLLDTNGSAEVCSGRRVPRSPEENRGPSVSGGPLFRSRPVGRSLDAAGVRSARGLTELRLVLRLRSRGKQPFARLRRRAS